MGPEKNSLIGGIPFLPGPLKRSFTVFCVYIQGFLYFFQDSIILVKSTLREKDDLHK